MYCIYRRSYLFRDLTIARIQSIYASIPKSVVVQHIADCTICKQKRTLPKAPVGKVIKSYGIWSRIGIDLVDMSSLPDRDFKWIYHGKDHLSKFEFAVPLKTKTCFEVTQATRIMLYQYGACKYLQHDRGGEFTGREMREMLAKEALMLCFIKVLIIIKFQEFRRMHYKQRYIMLFMNSMFIVSS